MPTEFSSDDPGGETHDEVPAKPVVSVVVPTFNGTFIDESISSVQAQTMTSWELIVVDDGSTDDTPQRVRRLAADDARVRLIEQVNGGVAAARNRGFAATTASSDYVLFLDHDDLLEPEAFARAIAVMEQRRDVAAVHAEITLIDSIGEPQPRRELDAGLRRFRYRGWRRVECDPTEPTSTDAIISSDCIITPGQVLIRRSSLGPEPFPARFNSYDDWMVWIEISRSGVMYYEPNPSLRYRLHGGNQSNNTAALFAGRRDTFRELLRSTDLSVQLRRSAAVALTRLEAKDSRSKLKHVVGSLRERKVHVAAVEAARTIKDVQRALIGVAWYVRLGFGGQHLAKTQGQERHS